MKVNKILMFFSSPEVFIILGIALLNAFFKNRLPPDKERIHSSMEQGKSTVRNSGQNDFARFVKRNKFLVVSGCILVVLVAVLIFVYSNLYGSNASKKEAFAEAKKPATPEGTKKPEQAVVLPQTEREMEDGTEAEGVMKQSGNPFAAPMKLSGILVSDNAKNRAIIEFNKTSFIVSQGDKVGEEWTVEKIDRGQVILKAEDRETVLEMSDKSNADKQK